MSVQAQVKERPLLMCGPMVRAILDGRKSQTRRVVKPQPSKQHHIVQVVGPAAYNIDGRQQFEVRTHYATTVETIECPHGRSGDHLWIRETWAAPWGKDIVFYSADGLLREDDGKWRPSIFMPRWASRLTLEIVAVRVERLQDISQEDARAEGIGLLPGGGYGTDEPFTAENSARAAFRELWNRLNEKRGLGWSMNPWVFVIEFKRA